MNTNESKALDGEIQGWLSPNGDGFNRNMSGGDGWIPLYAHTQPVSTGMTTDQLYDEGYRDGLKDGIRDGKKAVPSVVAVPSPSDIAEAFHSVVPDEKFSSSDWELISEGIKAIHARLLATTKQAPDVGEIVEAVISSGELGSVDFLGNYLGLSGDSYAFLEGWIDSERRKVVRLAMAAIKNGGKP